MHTIECKFCNTKCQKPYRRYVFCSRICQSKWLSKNKISGRKKKQVNCICKFCEKEYQVPQYRKNKTVFCSRSCLANHYLPINRHTFLKSPEKRHTYKSIRVNGKNMRLHRYLMEQHLARKLEKWEHVHHINGDSLDNRIENLEVLSNSEHQKKEHARRKILNAGISSTFLLPLGPLS